MPTQLRLFDDCGKQRRNSIWPTLPKEVQRHVLELFADVLVALVTNHSTTEPRDESTRKDLGDTQES